MKIKLALVPAAVLMLVISTVSVASNMGFKISIPLTAGYRNYVSLPYYNSYTDAASLFSDVPHVSTVSRWDNSTGSWQTYDGPRGYDFTITPGEAYIIVVTSSTTWIVVGSHNPSLSLTLFAGGYRNYVSVPYHTTAPDAAALFAQIPNVSTVSRWDNPSGSWQTYDGPRGYDFTIVPGEGLIIVVTATTSWVPAHY